MANCYRCGRPIEPGRYHLRRRVRTGDLERRRYAKNKSATVQKHYGMRVVCTGCARAIDIQNGRIIGMENLYILGALFVLLLVLIFSGFL